MFQLSVKLGRKNMSYYRSHVFVCTNHRSPDHSRGSCGAKGSEALRDYMKVRVKELDLTGVRINSAGCLDRCEKGPCVVVYPKEVWVRLQTRSDVDEFISSCLVGEGIPGRLRLKAY